ncbi:MAG: transcriptional regulator GcvA [Geminicoccaceae bacterium]|nr:MAG: transcriptional regulator GcvA [Geminicoccaceae bacterium]
MGRRLPPLNALRAFEAAARHLSFKRAAEELNVTPAAVSQHVKALEDQLGVALFRRLTRALVLTEAGRAAAGSLTLGFDYLATGVDVLRRYGKARALTVSVPPSFGARWLVPRLVRFQRAHPAIEVRIDARIEAIDFERHDVDLAIRFGSGRYPGLVTHCLISRHVFPVCSPELQRSSPALRVPADLAGHTLLHHQHPASPAVDPAWAMWLQAAGVRGIDAERGPRFSNHGLALDAAAAGHGVALADLSLVEDDLRTGRLVRPFAGVADWPSEFCYYLVHPPERVDDASLVAFRDWLMAEIAAFADASGLCV